MEWEESKEESSGPSAMAMAVAAAACASVALAAASDGTKLFRRCEVAVAAVARRPSTLIEAKKPKFFRHRMRRFFI